MGTPEIVELFAELCFAAGLETRYKMYTDAEKRGLMRRFIQGVRDLSKDVGIPENVPQLTREDVKEVTRRAMVESHGEDYPGSTGYPSPTCLDEAEITKVVSA